MIQIIKRIERFVTVDLWSHSRNTLSGSSRVEHFFLTQLRIVVLALRGFSKDRCVLRASALTFYSLLSIVPIVAMAFGIAKGFGFEKLLERQLYTRLQGQEEAVAKIVDFANSLLNNAQGGVIAGFGVLFLFWSVIKLLGQIEGAFNDVWGIQRSRPWSRKFSDYLSFMLIGPLLFVVASSATVVIASQITRLIEQSPLLAPVSGLILIVLRVLPFAVMWVLFTFVYTVMPNTRVQLKAAVVAGVLAGTLYQLGQAAYIYFQLEISQYGAIYGSLAALPFFLLWLNLSWLVVLLGAEMSFAVQNVHTYELEPDAYRVSVSTRYLVSLVVLQRLVRAFIQGEGPLSVSGLAQELDWPVRLLRQVLYNLVEAKLVSEVKGEGDKGVLYQMGCDVSRVSVASVLQALDHLGDTFELPLGKNKVVRQLKQALEERYLSWNVSSANLYLKDLS